MVAATSAISSEHHGMEKITEKLREKIIEQIWSSVPHARAENKALQGQFYQQIRQGTAQRWLQANLVSRWPTGLFQTHWSWLVCWLGWVSVMTTAEAHTVLCSPNTAHPWPGKKASFLGFVGFRFMKIKITYFQEKYCELWTACGFMFECYGLAQYLSGIEGRKQEGEKNECW